MNHTENHFCSWSKVFRFTFYCILLWIRKTGSHLKMHLQLMLGLQDPFPSSSCGLASLSPLFPIQTRLFQVSLWNNTVSQHLQVTPVKLQHTPLRRHRMKGQHETNVHVRAYLWRLVRNLLVLHQRSVFTWLAHAQRTSLGRAAASRLLACRAISNASLRKKRPNPLSPLFWLSPGMLWMKRRGGREKKGKGSKGERRASWAQIPKLRGMFERETWAFSA